jgi:hypothetical protein
MRQTQHRQEGTVCYGGSSNPLTNETRTVSARDGGAANAGYVSRRLRSRPTSYLRRISTEMDSRGLI